MHIRYQNWSDTLEAAGKCNSHCVGQNTKEGLRDEITCPCLGYVTTHPLRVGVYITFEPPLPSHDGERTKYIQ